jgi:transcriptional regulator with XRE-family HTH domain
METITQTPSAHMGRKIARVRDLRGLNQTQLGELLGMTKQAISKMEQTEKINDKRLKEIAEALGVTLQGLKAYKDESVLYYSYNFYENCGVSSSIGANNIENLNNYPFEKTMEFVEKILKAQTEKIEKLLAEKK